MLLVKKPQNLAEVQGIIAALLLNDLKHPCLYAFHTSYLHVYARDEVSWTLDGEFGGNSRDVRIKVIPKAYQIMAPQKEEP